MSVPLVRPATANDAQAINRIFDFYVAESHVTFETQPMSADDRRRWIDASDPHAFRIVAESERDVVGWASSGPISPRAAYSSSVEVSVYVEAGRTGMGIGRALLEALLGLLSDSGAHRVYAVVGIPNEESFGLFESAGFTRCAQLSEAGRKFGRWWDVAWLEYAVPTRT